MWDNIMFLADAVYDDAVMKAATSGTTTTWLSTLSPATSCIGDGGLNDELDVLDHVGLR